MYICQQKASMAAEALLERICPVYWIIQWQQTAIHHHSQNLTHALSAMKNSFP